jgi:hypothetical protein
LREKIKISRLIWSVPPEAVQQGPFRGRRQIFEILDHKAEKLGSALKALALDKILKSLVHFVGKINVNGFHKSFSVQVFSNVAPKDDQKIKNT